MGSSSAARAALLVWRVQPVREPELQVPRALLVGQRELPVVVD